MTVQGRASRVGVSPRFETLSLSVSPHVFPDSEHCSVCLLKDSSGNSNVVFEMCDNGWLLRRQFNSRPHRSGRVVYSMLQNRHWFVFARTLSYGAAANNVVQAANFEVSGHCSNDARLLPPVSMVHYESYLTREARMAGVRCVRPAKQGIVA